MKIKNILVLMSRVFLGGVFIYAGVVKIIQPAEFADAIDNYRIAPYVLVTIMAVVLPWVR